MDLESLLIATILIQVVMLCYHCMPRGAAGRLYTALCSLLTGKQGAQPPLEQAVQETRYLLHLVYPMQKSRALVQAVQEMQPVMQDQVQHVQFACQESLYQRNLSAWNPWQPVESSRNHYSKLYHPFHIFFISTIYTARVISLFLASNFSHTGSCC